MQEIKHPIQKRMVELATEYDVANMKLAEIAKLLDIDHLQKVKHHRDQLIKKELLTPREDNKTIKIMKNVLPNTELVTVPILGSVNAGPANIYAEGVVKGYLHVSSSLLSTKPSKQLFALEVVGDSMNDARVHGKYRIDPGDFVIADAATFIPRTGDYIISLFDDRANVKKFFRDSKSGQIALMSESRQNYPPIFIGEGDSLDWVVQGKVVGVAKSPKLAEI